MKDIFDNLPVTKEKLAYDLAIRYANINGTTEDEVYELFKSSYLNFTKIVNCIGNK